VPTLTIVAAHVLLSATSCCGRASMSRRQIRYRIARLGITTPNGDDGANSSHADD